MRRTAAVTRVLVVALAAALVMVLLVPAAPASAAWRDTATLLAGQTLTTGEARLRADTALGWRRIVDDTPWGAEIPSELEAFLPESHRLHPGERIRARIPVSALASGTTMQPRLTLSGATVPPSSEALSGRVSVAYTEVTFAPDAAWQDFHIDLTLSVVDDADAGEEFGGHLDLTGTAALLLSGRTWWDQARVEGLGTIEIGRPDDTEVPEPDVPDPDRPYPSKCPTDWDDFNVALAGSEPDGGWEGYEGWQHCLPLPDFVLPEDAWSFTPTLPLWLHRRTDRPISGIMFIPAESEPAGVLNSAWSDTITPVADGVYATTMSLSFSSEFIRDVVEGTSDGRFLIALRDGGTEALPYTFFLYGRLVLAGEPEAASGDEATGDDVGPGTGGAETSGDDTNPDDDNPDDDSGDSGDGDTTAPHGPSPDAAGPDDGLPPPRRPEGDAAGPDGDASAPDASDPGDADQEGAGDDDDLSDG